MYKVSADVCTGYVTRPFVILPFCIRSCFIDVLYILSNFIQLVVAGAVFIVFNFSGTPSPVLSCFDADHSYFKSP